MAVYGAATGVAKKIKAQNKTAQDKAKSQATYNVVTPDQTLKNIVSNAQAGDVQSPLTNGAVPGTGTGTIGNKPSVGITSNDYSSDPWNYLFSGVAVTGAPTGPARVGKDAKGNFGIFISDPQAPEVNRQIYIAGDPNDPSGHNIKVIDAMDGQGLINYVNETAASMGGIVAFKKMLQSRGYYGTKNITGSLADTKTENITTPAFSNALNSFLRDMTQRNYSAASTGSQQLYSAKTLLATGSQFGQTVSRPFTYYTYTPEVSAVNDINGFIQENLGRQATKSEVDTYVKQLKDFEQAHPERGVAQTDLGGDKSRITYTGASPDDKKMLLVGMLANELSAKGINPDEISKSGGAVARGMAELQKYAADYGLGHITQQAAMNSIIKATTYTAQKATNADTLSMMIDTLKPGGSIEQEKAKLQAQAKLLYKPLASYIDAGGNVKDVADAYWSMNQKYLETMAPTDVFNPDIQKALQGDGKGGLMSQGDYITMLKNKPEWQYTQNARQEAANYATTILKEFGFLA